MGQSDEDLNKKSEPETSQILTKCNEEVKDVTEVLYDDSLTASSSLEQIIKDRQRTEETFHRILKEIDIGLEIDKEINEKFERINKRMVSMDNTLKRIEENCFDIDKIGSKINSYKYDPDDPLYYFYNKMSEEEIRKGLKRICNNYSNLAE